MLPFSITFEPILSNTKLDGWGRALKPRRPESCKYLKDY